MESKVYTMEDWQRDKDLSPAVGQMVDNAVVWELIECLPPTYWHRGVFQVGEPYTHDKENGRPLYATFEQVNTDGLWQYKGHCLLGETEHRKGWGE